MEPIEGPAPSVMARFRGRRNKATELALVRLLRRHQLSGWRRHHRLRLTARTVPNTGASVPRYCEPDFVFGKAKVAVMVDGCFWHGCARHCRLPTTNSEYWVHKIARNQERDVVVAVVLKRNGWRVVRVWEHDLKTPERCVRRITAALEKSVERRAQAKTKRNNRSPFIATTSGRA